MLEQIPEAVIVRGPNHLWTEVILQHHCANWLGMLLDDELENIKHLMANLDPAAALAFFAFDVRCVVHRSLLLHPIQQIGTTDA